MADLDKLEKAVDELESHSRGLGEVNKMLSEIGSLKDGLEKNLNTLEENNKAFEIVTDNLKSSLAESLKQLTSKVDELYENNKNFYKEIDSLLHSLLEKHKSDIQVEIRNESQSIKKEQKDSQVAVENKLGFLDSKLSEVEDRQTKKTNLLIGLAFVILGVNVFLTLKLLEII